MQKEGKSDSDMPDSELEKCCLSDPSDPDMMMMKLIRQIQKVFHMIGMM